MVRLKVAVLVTSSTAAALAAKNAPRTIPIIVIGVTDPVAAGLVRGLEATLRGSRALRRCCPVSVLSRSRKADPIDSKIAGSSRPIVLGQLLDSVDRFGASDSEKLSNRQCRLGFAKNMNDFLVSVIPYNYAVLQHSIFGRVQGKACHAEVVVVERYLNDDSHRCQTLYSCLDVITSISGKDP